jgi:hypothetical protein
MKVHHKAFNIQQPVRQGGIMKYFKILSMVSILLVAIIGISPALQEGETGSVRGVVHPSEAMATIEASYNGEAIASTQADPETGAFAIDPLPPGTYTIVIIPGSEEYQQKVVNDVYIEEANDIDLGEIHLEWIEE